MIEFYGLLSNECRKDIKKRTDKNTIIWYGCAIVVLAVLTVILFFCGVMTTKELLEFCILLVLCCIVLLIVILTSNKYIKFKTVIRVVIENEFITQEAIGFNNLRKKPISKVKKIVDAGDWYFIIFRCGDVSNGITCQKDLLKKGTIEEFEKIFEGKIVVEESKG